MRYIPILILVFLPVFSLFGQQIEIKTSAPEELLENEVFEVKYEILSSTAVREMPKLVDAKDYEVQGEPKIRRSSPSSFWDNNYYALQLVFRLKPKKTGKLKLPRIELVYEDMEQSSRDGEIMVRELPEVEDVDCFVMAHSTKSQVNMGDTLMVTYKLYSTKEIAKVVSIHIPRLPDIYYQEMSPSRLVVEKEERDGKEYYVYLLRHLLLQPKSLGTKELPEGEVEIEYTYPTGRVRSDYWGRQYEDQLKETRKCKIEAISIRVHNMITV